MDRHTLELLEYGKIREELASYCFSEDGAACVEEQPFLFEEEEILRFTGMVHDFQRLIDSGKTFPRVHASSCMEILKKLAKEGSVLEASEFTVLRSMLNASRAVKRFLLSGGRASDEEESAAEAEPLPKESLLYAKASELPEVKKLEGEINHIITPDGEINDKLPELRRIKQRIQQLNGELSSIAAGYFSNPKYRDMMQSDVPGQKEGRTVLPLKSRYKARIPGLVQDVSDSGATVFIEPYALVEKNNEIAYEKGRYAQEVHRILKELTESVRTRAEEIDRTIDIIRFIDSIYARSRYSRIHRCSRIDITGREIDLRGARHPLIGADAVPIHIRIAEEINTLIISGPNTGGKTVGLKTVGLLALMHQFGMKIPAEESSKLPVFTQIFADIGDEQSIDLSLSTFSGHMQRISAVCARAEKKTLALLDELGSGTDSREGGALAMAVLDYLSETGCTTVATTHHSALKHYAFTRPGVENASVEFDLDAMRPTFRVITGVAGESHAMDIAETMGMDPHILENARGYIEQGETDISSLLEEISNKRRQLAEEEQRIRALRHETERKQRETEAREAEVARERTRIREGEITGLREYLDETRKRLENLVRELREGEVTKEKIRKSRELTKEMEERLGREKEKLREERDVTEKASPGESASAELAPGVPVLVESAGKEGTVKRKGKGNSWVVEIGSLKMNVPEKELKPLRKRKGKSVFLDVPRVEGSAEMQLDLRGLRYEEAVDRLTKQLDAAVMQGLTGFEIVHGKGEGVLREAVRAVLSENPAVEEFHFAPPELGGFGKTVVKLQKTH